MKTRKRKIKYKEKLTVREIESSKISPEERLNTIADIIIERIIEVANTKNLPLSIPNSLKGDQ